MKKLEVMAWLVGLLGFGLVVAGVSLISRPAAFIVAGSMLMGWSYLADRAAASPARAGHNSDGG